MCHKQRNNLLCWYSFQKYPILYSHDRPSKADVEAEVDKQAVKSAQKVLTDVADGIDMHESLLHR